MRMLLLAPLGALFACSDAGNLDGTYSKNDDGLDTDEEDLAGDYMSCEDALRDLGEEPITISSAEEEEEYSVFDIYLVDGGANNRPWVATLSMFEDGTFILTCGEMDDSGATTYVVPDLAEYWNCAFQYDKVSIHDPESDPGCNQGYEDYAYQGDQYFVQEAPGVFVLDED